MGILNCKYFFFILHYCKIYVSSAPCFSLMLTDQYTDDILIRDFLLGHLSISSYFHQKEASLPSIEESVSLIICLLVISLIKQF